MKSKLVYHAVGIQALSSGAQFFFFYRVLGIRLVGIVRKSIYTYLFYCSLISIFLFVPRKAMIDQKQTNKQAKDFTKV